MSQTDSTHTFPLEYEFGKEVGSLSKKKKTQAEEFAWFARQMVKTMRTMTNILAIMSLIVLIALLKG